METFIQKINGMSNTQISAESSQLKMEFFKFFDSNSILGGKKNIKKHKKRKQTKKTRAGTSSLSSNSSYNSNSSVHNEYDIIEDLALTQNEQLYDKLAEFYRYFLKNPGKYQDIFNVINKLNFDNDDHFNELNILSLMCFATFHICKFYLSINLHTTNNKLDQDEYNTVRLQIAEYYHLPLQEWLHYIIAVYDKEIEYKQNDDHGYHSPYQYLLLMSYISCKLPFEKRPIVSYLKAIDNRYIDAIYKPDIFNLADDVIEFLADDVNDNDAYSDIYDNNNRKQYIYDKNTSNHTEIDICDIITFHEDVTKNVFFNFKLTDILARISPANKDKEIDKIHKELSHTVLTLLKANNLKLFAYIQFMTNTHILFDLDPHDNNASVLYNQKCIKVFEVLTDILENSNDILNDFIWVIKTQNSIVTKTILLSWNDDKSIWFYLFKNKHFDKNHEILKELLLSFISNNFNKTVGHAFTNHWKKYVMNKGIQNLLELDPNKENVLIYLLKTFFDNPGDTTNMSFATPKSVFRDYGLTYNSISPNISDDISDPVKKDLKIILHNLLKLTANHLLLYYGRNDIRPYYNKLFTYKNNLLQYEIDLDKYEFYAAKKTPVAYADKSVIERSIENQKYVPRFHKEHKNLFSGFTNTKFMEKLLKIYMRTVEGVVENQDLSFYNKTKYIDFSPQEKKEFQKEQSKNGILRIAKIQRYISKLYMAHALLHSTTDLVDVDMGTEAEILFATWQLSSKPTLNRPFNITFKDFRGTIDAGGPTKQFFTHISNQIQNKYFRVIDEETNRWIFKENITIDEAEFIGQLLAVFIKLNIHLPFAISKLYIAHLMFKIERITHDHLYMYYLLDVSESQRNRMLDFCKMTVGKRRLESMVDTDYCNSTNVYTDYIVPTYNYNTTIMSAFSNGCFIDKGIFHSQFHNIGDRIRLYDLDKIISHAKLTKFALETHIFKKILIKYGANYDSRTIISEDDLRTRIYHEFRELMTKAKKNDFDNYYTNFLGTIEDPVVKQNSEEFKDNKKFKEAVLLFWSAINSISFTHSYKIVIHPDARYPSAGTCATELILPENSDKQGLYNDFMSLFSSGYLNKFGNL